MVRNPESASDDTVRDASRLKDQPVPQGSSSAETSRRCITEVNSELEKSGNLCKAQQLGTADGDYSKYIVQASIGARRQPAGVAADQPAATVPDKVQTAPPPEAAPPKPAVKESPATEIIKDDAGNQIGTRTTIKRTNDAGELLSGTVKFDGIRGTDTVKTDDGKTLKLTGIREQTLSIEDGKVRSVYKMDDANVYMTRNPDKTFHIDRVEQPETVPPPPASDQSVAPPVAPPRQGSDADPPIKPVPQQGEVRPAAPVDQAPPADQAPAAQGDLLQRQIASAQQFISDGKNSSTDKLQAIDWLAKNGVSQVQITERDGSQRTYEIQEEQIGNKTMVHLFGTGADGQRHIVLRGLLDQSGNFTQEQDKNGRKVNFEGDYWTTKMAGASTFAPEAQNPADRPEGTPGATPRRGPRPFGVPEKQWFGTPDTSAPAPSQDRFGYTGDRHGSSGPVTQPDAQPPYSDKQPAPQSQPRYADSPPAPQPQPRYTDSQPPQAYAPEDGAQPNQTYPRQRPPAEQPNRRSPYLEDYAPQQQPRYEGSPQPRYEATPQPRYESPQQPDRSGRGNEISPQFGVQIAQLAIQIARTNPNLVGANGYGECSKVPRLVLEQMGLKLDGMSGVNQGRLLERSGLFVRVSKEEARAGDYAYRHWSYRAGDLGDSLIVTGRDARGNVRGINGSTRSEFTVDTHGGYYQPEIYLRPTTAFYDLMAKRGNSQSFANLPPLDRSPQQYQRYTQPQQRYTQPYQRYESPSQQGYQNYNQYQRQKPWNTYERSAPPPYSYGADPAYGADPSYGMMNPNYGGYMAPRRHFHPGYPYGSSYRGNNRQMMMMNAIGAMGAVLRM